MKNTYITFDAAAIISGTSNKTHPLYIEAANAINKQDKKEDVKSISYLKKFITSIETVNAKITDKRISSSKGDIERLSFYDTLESGVNIIKEHSSEYAVTVDSIFTNLKRFKPYYQDAYDANNRLIILEYESAVHMLVIGMSYILASCISISDSGVTSVKGKSSSSMIDKILVDIAKTLASKKHEEYMKAMKEGIKSTSRISESVMMESAVATLVAETIGVINGFFTGIVKLVGLAKFTYVTLKQTLFGILPLIRSCIYLKYKSKADTVVNLEEQIEHIKTNIEHLKNKKMDPAVRDEIIKKQEAYIVAYTKKAAKIRAELITMEQDATDAIKTDDVEIRKDASSDDSEFVLERTGIHFEKR